MEKKAEITFYKRNRNINQKLHYLSDESRDKLASILNFFLWNESEIVSLFDRNN